MGPDKKGQVRPRSATTLILAVSGVEMIHEGTFMEMQELRGRDHERHRPPLPRLQRCDVPSLCLFFYNSQSVSIQKTLWGLQEMFRVETLKKSRRGEGEWAAERRCNLLWARVLQTRSVKSSNPAEKSDCP
jgi:hypothetical protein